MFTFTTRTAQTAGSLSFVTEVDSSGSYDAGTNDPAYDSSSNSFTVQARTSSFVDTEGNIFITQTSFNNHEFLTSADGAGIAQTGVDGRTVSYLVSSYTNGNLSVASFNLFSENYTSQANDFAISSTYEGAVSVSVFMSGDLASEMQTFTTGTTTISTLAGVSKSATVSRQTTEAYINTDGNPAIRSATTEQITSSIVQTTMQSVVFGTQEQAVEFYIVAGSTTSNATNNLTTADAISQEIIQEQTNTVFAQTQSSYPTFATATVVEPRNNIVWSLSATTISACHLSQIAQSFTERTTIVPTYTSQQMATKFQNSSVAYSEMVSQETATLSSVSGFGPNNTTAETIARISKTGTQPFRLPAQSVTVKKTTGETVVQTATISNYTTAITADGTSKQFGFVTHALFPFVSSSKTIESVWRQVGTLSAQSNVLYRSTNFVNVNAASSAQYISRNEIKEGQTIQNLHFANALQLVPNALPAIADKTYAEQFADPAKSNIGSNVSAQGRTIEFVESSKTASVAKQVGVLRPGSHVTGQTTYSFGDSVSISEPTITTIVPWVVVGMEKTHITTRSHKIIENADAFKNAQTLPNLSVFAAYTNSPVDNNAPTIFIPPGYYATSNNSTSGTVYLSQGTTSQNQSFVVYNTFAPAFASVGDQNQSPYLTIAANYYKIPASSQL